MGKLKVKGEGKICKKEIIEFEIVEKDDRKEIDNVEGGENIVRLEEILDIESSLVKN